MREWKNDVIKIAVPTPFPVGDVNVFLLKGDALTLVDTGVKTEEALRALKSGLGELRLELGDIEQIIVTHHHIDHISGVDFFDVEVPLLGHKNNDFWIGPSEEDQELLDTFFREVAIEMGVPAEYAGLMDKAKKESDNTCGTRDSLTGWLQEGEEVPGLPGWRVYETPGHAETHICLFRESDGAMIGGDLLLEKVSPNPLLEPPMEQGKERPKAQLLLNDSLRKVAKMPVSRVYAGHGNIIENPHELISFRLKAQHDRAMKVKEMLRAEPLTTYEVCMRLFPKIFLKQPGLTLSESQGQLDYLLDLGEIKEEKTDQTVIYRVK